MGRKRKGFVTLNMLVGALLIVSAVGVGGAATDWTFDPDQAFAATGGGPGDSENRGSGTSTKDRQGYSFETGEIKASVYNQALDSRAQVAVDVHYQVSESVTTVLSSASDRVKLGDFNAGEEVSLVAFNSSDYFYSEMKEVTVDEPIKRPNLDTYKPISSSNVVLDVFGENDNKNPSSISLGADDSYTFEDLKVAADASDRTYNPKIVAFKYSDNISEVVYSSEDIKEMESVPDSLSNYDQAFIAFDAKKGEPLLMERESENTGQFTVVSDKDSDPASESLDIAVKDSALHLTDEGTWKYAVEDSSDNDVGVSDVTKSIPIS